MRGKGGRVSGVVTVRRTVMHGAPCMDGFQEKAMRGGAGASEWSSDGAAPLEKQPAPASPHASRHSHSHGAVASPDGRS